MRWCWWRRQRAREPSLGLNPRRQELETAKEILAEVFGARPSDVEEMIRLRLEKRNWLEQGEGCFRLHILSSKGYGSWVTRSATRSALMAALYPL
jgi:hypothetical protein